MPDWTREFRARVRANDPYTRPFTWLRKKVIDRTGNVQPFSIDQAALIEGMAQIEQRVERLEGMEPK